MELIIVEQKHVQDEWQKKLNKIGKNFVKLVYIIRIQLPRHISCCNLLKKLIAGLHDDA